MSAVAILVLSYLSAAALGGVLGYLLRRPRRGRRSSVELRGNADP